MAKKKNSSTDELEVLHKKWIKSERNTPLKKALRLCEEENLKEPRWLRDAFYQIGRASVESLRGEGRKMSLLRDDWIYQTVEYYIEHANRKRRKKIGWAITKTQKDLEEMVKSERQVLEQERKKKKGKELADLERRERLYPSEFDGYLSEGAIRRIWDKHKERIVKTNPDDWKFTAEALSKAKRVDMGGEMPEYLKKIYKK